MWLTRTSVDNPYFAAVLMIALTVLGLFAGSKMAVEEFPDIRFPVAAVTTAYPGASPEVVESEVTRPLEEAINTIAGIKHIRSYSMEGVSTLVVEFELSADPNLAVQEVRDRVSGVQGTLRREVKTPAVSQFNPNDEPLISLSFNSSEAGARALTDWVDNVLKKRLQTVSGVGEVKVLGGARREVRVELDPLRLEALGVAVDDVASALSAGNRDWAAGALGGSEQERSLRVEGKFATPASFGDLLVSRRADGEVRLSDIAIVRDAEAERVSVALIDGKPGVGVDIRASRGANVVEVAEGVKRTLDALKPAMPAGTVLTVTYDKSVDVERSLAEVRQSLVEGAALTVLIVFLFLGSWRSTVITGLTLPISLIGTLFAVWALGFTLNLMTLMALSLSIGLLIDDAIVVRENIVRHAALGKGHRQAALDGTNEIGLAVLATTLTIVAVFLPVGFMGGIIGKFFHQFGLTVVVAVLISMLVSFTLDPMLSSVWADPHHHGDRHRGPLGRMLDWFESSLDRLADAYVGVVAWALAHRKTVLAAAALLTVGSFALVPAIGGEFLPRADKGEFVVVLKAPPGSTLEYSERKAREVEARLRTLPEVRSVEVKVAGGRFGAGKTEARVKVDIGRAVDRTRDQDALMRDARALAGGVAGVEVDEVSALGQHGGGGKPVNVGVRGGNVAELERTAAMLAERIRRVDGVSDVATSLDEADPALTVRVDRDAAAALGVDPARVGQTLATLTAGAQVTTWEAPDGENYDVVLQLPKAERADALLEMLTVAAPGAGGAAAMVPLSALASTEDARSPRQIERVDLMREVSISANVQGRSPGAVFADVDRLLADTPLPPRVQLSQQGERQDMQESFSYALQALALGVVFIYMILAAQFRSFTLPLTIMVALPLSFVGVFFALWAWGSTLNMFSVIGIVMLMGLAAKNGILLVDFIGQARREGAPRDAAIVEAGRVRLRPIMMTSLAMIFGMLPLALASGEGSETQRPMAQAIIGGLVTSTLLTLVVLPVVYTYLDALRVRLRRLVGAPVAGS
ncbi:efflux RND transporter permease subunit [Crenobacter intestini]|uniref:Efflux RND transporter permease subunit n=1 Tax=Crenobacter intestini TaxID=2563443 RepID=A0A4V4N7Y0_9NEIS|nr:efflux RND transporter permease subunit [Crenobacter intestini]TIC82353.1 efflux RND transporter permease subunit [Crenobacter intestini]